jgi:hypothetical protein
MSKVALLLGRFGSQKVEVVKIIRAGLGLEFRAITESAGSGKPVIIQTLFGRTEPTFAERLQPVLEYLEKIGVEYTAFEIPATKEFSNVDTSTLYRIDSKRLKRMIEARARSIEEQIDFGALEDGDL